ncbi:MFS transporter [Streptomyces abyssalis]|uniref:MFS transporter n=1 Tax=Streptomyces abyssalis TaxID=933944 RepID=A0A1E7JST4_9ACTN|nr:MFS transporter [Streptomyces abyssalis]OEU91974.1 MFS transporter [Streptomyces abyssalis]OEU93883.1 MFS transporter [Streptomyces abyssalis]
MVSHRAAVAVVFVVNGGLYGAWAARVPALASQVQAEPAGLGLALLGPSIAMIVTAPLAARACAAWGARRVIVAALAAACLALPLVGLAGSPLTLGLALAGLGGLMGTVDVAMNVAAVAVVRELGRPLMPFFHAGFSAGGLLGSLGAALAAALSVAPAAHFCFVTAAGLLALLCTGRGLPGERPEKEQQHTGGGFRNVLVRKRLWLLAAVALCAAVAEGTCAEWSALFLVREREVTEAVAATAYSVFSVTMALTRLVGERVEARFGPYRVLAGSGLVAACGLTASAAVPAGAVAYAGFALAGAGLAFCFPVAMALAGDAGRREDGSGGERELGFVTTVAYAGFLGGPPLVGGVASLTSLTVSIGLVGLLTALITPTALAVRGSRRKSRQPSAERQLQQAGRGGDGPA